ncbi:hypothetical protein [Castellaniella denitrificans]|uniref:Uncharacterized protein n=1 Tax=Castellaniella denitrificans TaxID=56119 RepID=A0ABT4M615_9BURK|nr:hypothetical protein [Castellaniella denitrificans]MCZ4330767.1 hypothetical protein [Castellaniella denitrificans]
MSPIVSWVNGLPYTADGKLAVENAAVLNVQNGHSFTASGRIALSSLV